jgi:tartrate dehydrogenase/decarboxylase/D-malate dehydrogenase
MATTQTHKIAVIAGDGIGKEVIPAGIAAIEAATKGTGITLSFSELPWGCEFYLKKGRMLDDDGFERLSKFDAIYLGAIGAPTVPDHISAGDLLLPLRKHFNQYINLRPMRLLPGLNSPLANRNASEIDMVCVRENTEGEYSGVGGRVHVGTEYEIAEQTGVFTRHGIERVVRYACEVAAKRPRRMLASATKSNALRHSMVLWDEVADGVAAKYPAVNFRKYYVDAIAARMVTHPQTLDVIVASNLFGDILTDLGAAVSGSLGVAPGANINPERDHPSMFEPIHGSAPDIAGKGIANPIGAIWAGALMLDHLGHQDLHDRIVAGIERVVAGGKVRTPDLGGTANTADMMKAVAAEI